MVKTKKVKKPRTIGDLHAKGKLPPDMMLPITVQHMEDMIEKNIKLGWSEAEKYLRGEGRSFICDMLLPDGTCFGDATLSDLMPYADKTMDEIVALLVDPDEDEADFIEDGSTPAPDEADFISEEEDENPSGVVR